MSRRDLERDHQARTLKAAGEIEGRPSREDERLLTDEARKREAERAEQWQAAHAAAVAELEDRIAAAQDAVHDVRSAIVRVAGGVTGRDYRDLDAIRRALNRIKTRNGPADNLGYTPATRGTPE